MTRERIDSFPWNTRRICYSKCAQEWRVSCYKRNMKTKTEVFFFSFYCIIAVGNHQCLSLHLDRVCVPPMRFCTRRRELSPGLTFLGELEGQKQRKEIQKTGWFSLSTMSVICFLSHLELPSWLLSSDHSTDCHNPLMFQSLYLQFRWGTFLTFWRRRGFRFAPKVVRGYKI